MKVVIVGGVAGGATAAARIRRLDENAEIIVLERSGYVSYANCGLPYYIGGVIEDASELTLQTPESFLKRFNVIMRVHNEVEKINPDKKSVTVRNLETGEMYEESYDRLLLSPGAKPTLPPMAQSGDVDGLFSLRTVEDTLTIHDYVEKNHPKSVVLAGGGFIAMELAENFCDMGMDVTVVQRPRQVMHPFDPEMASFLHAKLRSRGIHLFLGRSVEGFSRRDGQIQTLLDRDEKLYADMAILCIGVTPDTRLAKDAGLELGIKGSIVVDDQMRTSCKDIYAVGDAVEVRHTVTGEKCLLSLAGPANKQGRIAADNICGGQSRYKGSLGSSVLKVFDMTAAVTGINETNALKSGIQVDKVYLSPANHAGYYPGGKAMSIKIVFEKDTYRLLGGQIVGYEGVDKRIDVLATAIQCGLRAYELKDLDLAYAPPYSSAKDPLNMAGYMIDNIASGKMKQYFWDEIDHIAKDGSVTLLDTRTPGEYRNGHIDGFINIPVDELRKRIGEIPPKKPVYVICQSGLRSYIATRILMQNGFDAYNFSGGYRLYRCASDDGCMPERTWPCGMDRK